jgi:Zn-dependent peptidase ImmA (M78 family)/DNA-binding XRE family transcriptional regulator
MKPGTPGFVGERLRAAREARGIMTAAGLAEMIGVSRAAVSQYECGEQTPSPAVMRQISETLNLPSHHFTRAAPQSDATRFFRSMASATKAVRVRADRKCDWLREIVACLKAHLKFPVADFPQFHLPADPLKITDEMIEDAATKLRRHWGLGDGPISNMAWLLENKGAVVVRLDLESDKLDAFSKWHAGDGSPYVILGTNKGTAPRMQFNAGHELAHMILHRDVAERTLNNPVIFKEVERQANRFSGAFLLPADTFLRDIFSLSLDGMRAAKPRWKVAIAAMVHRAHDLGAIREQDAKGMWIQLARRGWKRKEPYDDSIIVEAPRFLRRCFSTLIEKNRIRPEEFPVLMAIGSADVEELANLPRGYLSAPPAPEASIPEAQPDVIKFPGARRGGDRRRP